MDIKGDLNVKRIVEVNKRVNQGHKEHGDISSSVDLAIYTEAWHTVNPLVASLALVLPNALSLPTDICWQVTVHNDSSTISLLVKDKMGTSLATVEASSAVRVTLIENVTAAGEWHVEDLDVQSSTTLNALTDTSVATPNAGDVLTYDSSLNKWKGVPPSSSNSSMVGKTWNVTFTLKSKAKNKFINLVGSNIPSNETAAIMIWKSKLVGIYWTNERRDVDVDVEIYAVAEEDGTSPKNLVFEWPIVSARAGRKTEFPTDIIFDKGDKLSAYLADKGGDPQQIVVHMELMVLEDNSETVNTNWNGNVSICGWGTS